MNRGLIISLLGVVLMSSCTSTPEIGEFKLVAENRKFPEGPAWNHKDTYYVSNCKGDWITRIKDSVVDTFLTTEDFDFGLTNGMMVAKSGLIYACDYKYGRILAFTPKGEAKVVSDGYEGKPFNRPNDLAFWGDYLYFTDPNNYSSEEGDGRLFRIELTSGKVELLKDQLHFPNGLAFAENKDELYLCESALNRILKLKIDESGKIIETSTFIELPGGDPDGIAFDVKGNLYAAHFGSGTLFIMNKKGEIIKKVKTPGKKPSNIEFGGSDMKDLILTEDETDCIYQIRVSIPGLSVVN